MTKEMKSKKYAGVFYRELANGDRSYFLRLRIGGKIKRFAIGKKSEGVTEAFCNQEKIRIVNESKHERATSAPGHFSTIRQYEKALNVPAEHLFPDIFNS